MDDERSPFTHFHRRLYMCDIAVETCSMHGYTNAAPPMAQENLLAAQSAVDVPVQNPKN